MRSYLSRGRAGPVAALALGAAALCSPQLATQSIYGVSGPAAGIFEFTGPPAGACAYPSGPGVSAFPTAAPFLCPLPGPFGAAPFGLGDVAVNRITDVIWASDGFVVGCYSRAGAPISGFPLPPGFVLPGPILGMGFDAPAGLLWLTDGAFAAAIAPPPPPGCAGPAPVIVIPPFPLPPAGPWTDIDWDSTTGSLFACSAVGAVANVLPGGAAGPFGMFPGAGPCALGPLTGIAVDAAAPAGSGTLYLTDGAVRSRVLPPGVPAPPTFYTPVPCAPILGAPLAGLAFAARAIAYGASFPTPSLVMGSKGQSIAPNPAFGLTLAGAPPGSIAVCYAGFGAACPPLALPFPVYLTLAPAPLLLGGGLVGAGGGLGLGAPIPPFAPGLGIYAQWFLLPPIPAAPIWSTHALAFTTSAP